jgi:two-component system, cell cycle response regulator
MTSSSRFGDPTDPCTLLLPSSSMDGTERHGACLVVIRGDRLGARVELGGGIGVVIGRGSDADFQIASRSVSRSHCRITERDGSFWVEDLRSTNHTYVNEELIDQRELKDGDQLRVGKSVLKFLGAGNLEAGYLAEMREHAVRDELTNLYNRRHVMSLLGDEVAQCVRDDQHTLSLAIIDIDNFKEINDRIGHLAGDAVLKQMAEVLEERVRAGDTLARIGGEEFCVVMPETGLKGALEVCERLRAAVAGNEFLLEDGSRLDVTVSIGLTPWTQDMAELSDLMRLADQHLYEAKSSGRNRVCHPR